MQSKSKCLVMLYQTVFIYYHKLIRKFQFLKALDNGGGEGFIFYCGLGQQIGWCACLLFIFQGWGCIFIFKIVFLLLFLFLFSCFCNMCMNGVVCLLSSLLSYIIYIVIFYPFLGWWWRGRVFITV